MTQILCGDNCPVCGGSGYIRNEREVTDPHFGKLDFCPRLDRLSLPSTVRLGLTRDELRGLSWQNSITLDRETRPAMETLAGLIKGHAGWIYLWGDYGIAKTLLLKIAVAECNRGGVEAAYVRMSEIMDNIREGYGNDAKGSLDADSRLDWWSCVPILAIDEFDRMRLTDYAEERQFLMMDRRYTSAIRRETSTILAANSPPSSLPGYLQDRISDGRFTVLPIAGQSKRPAASWSWTQI